MGALADYRTAIAGALADLDPEYNVHPAPVDALEPPAFLLQWTPTEDALTRSTSCVYGARLDVVCVSARLDPEPGIETLETMIERALAALDAASFPAVRVGPFGPFDIGGVQYQASRIAVTSPVTIGGN